MPSSAAQHAPWQAVGSTTKMSKPSAHTAAAQPLVPSALRLPNTDRSEPPGSSIDFDSCQIGLREGVHHLRNGGHFAGAVAIGPFDDVAAGDLQSVVNQRSRNLHDGECRRDDDPDVKPKAGVLDVVKVIRELAANAFQVNIGRKLHLSKPVTPG